MRCPYQLRVIHQPGYDKGYERQFAEDITEFGECIKNECPFYYMEKGAEKCYRVKAETESNKKGEWTNEEPN